MEKALIVLASSSAVHAVKTMLEKRYKIYTKIIQAPSVISRSGCSYCLEIDKSELRYAINLIRVSDMSIRGIYDSVTYEKISL